MEWRSKQDYLLGLVCPDHCRDIKRYYEDGRHLIKDLSSEKDIETIDNILAAVLIELGRSYEMLQQEGWLKGGTALDKPGLFMKRMTMSSIRHSVTPLVPHRMRDGPAGFNSFVIAA